MSQGLFASFNSMTKTTFNVVESAIESTGKTIIHTSEAVANIAMVSRLASEQTLVESYLEGKEKMKGKDLSEANDTILNSLYFYKPKGA